MSVVSNNEDRKTRTFTALVADDHEFVRNWIRDQLVANFADLSTVHVTGSPRQAIQEAVSLKPDLITMDIDFENDRSVNGIDAAEQIWKGHPGAAIIVVSSHKGELFVDHLYKVTPPDGAYGYVLKDKVQQCLVEAVKAVLSGDCWVDSEISRIANRILRSNRTLTDNEYEALICICLGLSDRAAGQLLCLTEKAIQARLQLLYSKFGIPPKGHPDAALYNSRCRSIWCALQRGLVNEAELTAWAAELSSKAKEIGMELALS